MNSADAVYILCLINFDVSVFMEKTKFFKCFMDCKGTEMPINCVLSRLVVTLVKRKYNYLRNLACCKWIYCVTWQYGLENTYA